MANGVDGSNQMYKFGGGLLFLDGKEIGAVQNATLEVAMETASLRDGTEMFPFIIENAAGSITGTADFAILNQLGAAALFGESIVGSGVVAVKGEEITAAASVNLANTPLADPSGAVSVYYENTTTGTVQQYERVEDGAAPAAGQFRIGTGAELVFNASDPQVTAGSTVKVDYFYESASANSWYLQTTSFPPQITMVLAAYGRDRATNATGHGVVIARNVRLTNWTWGFANDAEIRIDSITFTIAGDAADKALEFHQPGGVT
jgi:hypothetical protein